MDRALREAMMREKRRIEDELFARRTSQHYGDGECNFVQRPTEATAKRMRESGMEPNDLFLNADDQGRIVVPAFVPPVEDEEA